MTSDVRFWHKADFWRCFLLVLRRDATHVVALKAHDGVG
jgi:hypothetical protein